MIKIRIKNKSGFECPEYKTKGSAGCDLKAVLMNSVVMQPYSRMFFRTGVSIALPEGYEAQVRGRSGLNKDFGIVCPVGTIDSDFRGEIGVVLYNLGSSPYLVSPGQRIAQLVISPVVQAEWEQVEMLEETERGVGGFGSTGK